VTSSDGFSKASVLNTKFGHQAPSALSVSPSVRQPNNWFYSLTWHRWVRFWWRSTRVFFSKSIFSYPIMLPWSLAYFPPP